jgi:hypothetical protein
MIGRSLSPYIFLFVADNLSMVINHSIQLTALQEFKICSGISNLMFVDDCLMFFRAKPDQALVIKGTIDAVERGTCQMLNANKCSLLFNDNCLVATQNEVRQILEVSRQSFEDKYLGLPTPEGRMNKGKFDSLQAELSKRIMQWNDLSQGGKEIMGVFKLPMSVCDDLSKLIRNFWSGAERGKRKTHSVSWDILCRPKPHGGMGFRDMRLFSQALLARQAWRLVSIPNSLCARVLRSKYYPQGNIIYTENILWQSFPNVERHCVWP